MTRAYCLALLVGCLVPSLTLAQDPPRDAVPVVDTVIIVTHNIFGPEEARLSVVFQVANAVHIRTRASVVRRELLFRAGEPYDSARFAETERNLRRLGIFRDVTIDTVRIGSRLAAVVQTADGWTTELQFNMRSTGGTFTWSTGVIERNFLGTATRAGVRYREDPDRTGLTLLTGMERAFGSPVLVEGLYDKLSDGVRGAWTLGIPWRAHTDRVSFGFPGAAGRERVLLYRDGEVADSLERRSLYQSARYAYAPYASTSGYVRVGVVGQLMRLEHVAHADTGLPIPDTVTAALGVYGEASRARYKVVTHYNGFARDYDVDLSSRVSLATWVAPTGLGYDRTGVGTEVAVQAGVSLGQSFARLNGVANALSTSAGLDSGRVWLGLTVAMRQIPRNATVFHIEAGSQSGTAAGAEYDLGHGIGPRAFGPHAFTGTRMVWGALEHRAFLIDEVFGMLGIGFAAFVDYGGAWFPDQRRRLGGDFGVGLRLGATRATGPRVGRLDLAYKFGDGAEDGRWVFSFGRGFGF